jgi:hypothetical protein
MVGISGGDGGGVGITEGSGTAGGSDEDEGGGVDDSFSIVTPG